MDFTHNPRRLSLNKQLGGAPGVEPGRVDRFKSDIVHRHAFEKRFHRAFQIVEVQRRRFSHKNPPIAWAAQSDSQPTGFIGHFAVRSGPIHTPHFEDGDPIHETEVVPHSFQQAAQQRAAHVFPLTGQRIGQLEIHRFVHFGLFRVKRFDGLLAGQRIGDDFIQPAANQDIPDQFLPLQYKIPTLGWQLVRHQRERDTVVAVHAGHFFDQIGGDLHIQPVVRHGCFNHISLLLASELEGFKQRPDVLCADINAHQPFHFLRRDTHHPPGLRDRIEVRDTLGDLSTGIQPHQLGRPGCSRDSRLGRHALPKTERRFAGQLQSLSGPTVVDIVEVGRFQ